MRYIQIVFSPAGGTLKAANAVSEAWGESVETVDLTDPKDDFSGYSFTDGDFVLIALPSYGGRVPAVAAERLGKIKGGGAKCTLLCVYGNRAYDDTLAEMAYIAESCGFEVRAAIAAVAEHSIARQYASGRPDGEDVKRLREYAAAALEKMRGEGGDVPKLPGNRPEKKAAGAGAVPKANQYCVKCGLCAEKCPVQAISRENIGTADKKKCISCMRCVKICPHGARKINGVMAAAVSVALKKSCSERKECELFI